MHPIGSDALKRMHAAAPMLSLRIEEGLFGSAHVVEVPNLSVRSSCCNGNAVAPVTHVSFGNILNDVNARKSTTTSRQTSLLLRKRKHRKQVCFNNTVHVREVKHIKDMDPAESAMLWHSRSEYSLMKHRIRCAVQKMKQQMEFSSTETLLIDGFCILGLERIFREAYHPHLSRHALRNQNLRAVLQEQRLQREFRHVNPERLANASRLATAKSKVIAWNLAQSIVEP
jgi:hypothetical protein